MLSGPCVVPGGPGPGQRFADAAERPDVHALLGISSNCTRPVLACGQLSWPDMCGLRSPRDSVMRISADASGDTGRAGHDGNHVSQTLSVGASPDPAQPLRATSSGLPPAHSLAITVPNHLNGRV